MAKIIAPVQILYEDNHLLAAVKPQGVPSQADSSGDPDILTILKHYIKDRYQKPGNVYLGLVHRLDRPTGGVMLFARTSKAAARLSAQLKTGAFRKTYYCVCQGRPGGGVMQDYLVKDENTNYSRVAAKEEKGAKLAKLEYSVLETKGGLSLCGVRLLTGRSHQIRVQFSHAGHPLYADARYNSNAQAGQWLALWAARIEFTHPTKGDTITIQSKPPAIEPWVLFLDDLE